MIILSLINYNYCNSNGHLWLELLGENSNPFNTTDVAFKINFLLKKYKTTTTTTTTKKKKHLKCLDESS